MKKECEKHRKKINIGKDGKLTAKQEQRKIDQFKHKLTCVDCMQKEWPNVESILSDAVVILLRRYFFTDLTEARFNQTLSAFKRRLKAKKGTEPNTQAKHPGYMEVLLKR